MYRQKYVLSLLVWLGVMCGVHEDEVEREDDGYQRACCCDDQA